MAKQGKCKPCKTIWLWDVEMVGQRLPCRNCGGPLVRTGRPVLTPGDKPHNVVRRYSDGSLVPWPGQERLAEDCGAACDQGPARGGEAGAPGGPVRPPEKPAREVYDAAVKQAREVYDAAEKPAREVYDAAVKQAWEVYDAAVKQAWEVYDAAVKQARVQR